jgi:hypothetical protein
MLEFLRFDERVEQVSEQQSRDDHSNEHFLIPSSMVTLVQMWRKDD